MKGNYLKDDKLEGQLIEPELRRSGRERKAPKENDCYVLNFIGNDDGNDLDPYDEEIYPRRRRKRIAIDDNQDYDEGHRTSKKRILNSNRVENLLDWKNRLELLPITIDCLQLDKTKIEPQMISKVKTVKNICNQNLSAFGEDIEALFINIDWGKKGQSLKDLQNTKIQSLKLMTKGLAFIWAPKSIVYDILCIMEKKDFTYIENFQIINLDIQKAKEHAKFASKSLYKLHKGAISNSSTQTLDKIEENTEDGKIQFQRLIKLLENVDPCDLIAQEKSEYFNESKKTLLMFKKNSNQKVQLRHQRTCDVVFDMPEVLGAKCASDIKSYIYNMIETLLPDCLTLVEKKKNCFHLKMMEIWGDKDSQRRGWISIVQE